jgi:hypothetical protein
VIFEMDEKLQIKPAPGQASLDFERDENFVTLYANNITFEAAIWDLKMIFGQLDQRDKIVVEQHTAITIPWLQAKLLIYLLQVNVSVFEAEHGKIQVPERFIQEPQVLPGSPSAEAEAQIKIVRQVRDEFIASLKR